MKKLFFVLVCFFIVITKNFSQDLGDFTRLTAVETNQDILIFFASYNEWLEAGGETLPLESNEQRLDNFIIIRKEGLVTEDLKTHSLNFCSKLIKEAKDRLTKDSKYRTWIYIALEDRNNIQLIEDVLKFLTSNNIDYKFASSKKLLEAKW